MNDSGRAADIRESDDRANAPHEIGYCWQCGYDLRGLGDPRCPECGFRFDIEAVRELNAEWCALRIRGMRDAALMQGVACGVVLAGVLTRGWPMVNVLLAGWILLCMLIWAGVAYVRARDTVFGRATGRVGLFLGVVVLSLVVGRGVVLLRVLLLLGGMLLAGIELQRFMDGRRRGKMFGVEERLVESVQFSDRVNRALMVASAIATAMVLAYGL